MPWRGGKPVIFRVSGMLTLNPPVRSRFAQGVGPGRVKGEGEGEVAAPGPDSKSGGVPAGGPGTDGSPRGVSGYAAAGSRTPATRVSRVGRPAISVRAFTRSERATRIR